jgi:hypothetical protein
MNFRFILLGLVLLALAGMAGAQTPGAGANAGQSRDITQSTTLGPPLTPGLHEMFSLGSRWQPDVEWDTGGRARVNRENLAVGVGYFQSPTLQYGLVFDHEVSRYEYDGAAVDPTWRAQPGEMRVERLSANLRRPLDSKWSLYAAADGNWSLARGASYADAFTWGGMAGARDQVATNFAFTIGLFAHTRLDAGLRVLPIPGIEWRINDDWKLATAQGLTLTRTFNRHWQADFAVLVENREYRMPAEQPFGSGVLRDRSVPLVTTLRWAPIPGMFAQLSAGVSPWQEQRLTDRADAPDLTEQSHWSPSLALAAGLRF